MKAIIQHRFLQRLPGPYTYRRGNDGVDETFDIICVDRGQHIGSTYFWEEEHR